MKYKLILNPPKKQLVQEHRLKADDLLYLIIHSIIDLAQKNNVESKYIEALKRIVNNNEEHLKTVVKNVGIKVEKKYE